MSGPQQPGERPAPDYAIEFDKAARLLRLRLSGFWTEDVLRRFAADLLAAVQSAGAAGTPFDVLSDTSRFPVQSTEVAQGFERIMQAGASMHQGRTAIVVASTLNKIQAERIFTEPTVRIFTAAEEAARWLERPRED